MRLIGKGILVCLLGLVAAVAVAMPSEQTFADRVEMMDWSDPERAAQLLDTAQTAVLKRSPELQLMEVRGMVFADVRRDADFDATVNKLHAMTQDGDEAATLAEHYVRAYSLYQRAQYAAASRELSHIEIDSIASDTERYRVAILRGNKIGRAHV